MFRHLFDFRFIQARLARINYWYVLAICVAAFFGWNAFQDWRISRMDYNSAVHAYEDGDFYTAFQVFERLAEEGDVYGQYALGVLYSRGHGTEGSQLLAAEWLLKASEQGEVEAMVHLADLLYTRFHSTNGGLPEDLVASTGWYRRAAEAGNIYGQRRFGWALIKGHGIAVDHEAGLSWLMRAVDGGSTQAMYNLGQVHQFGDLGEPNWDQALHWYLRAARRGHIDGIQRAIDLLEDEQLPLFDLEGAYVWAMIGRHWWRDDPQRGPAFANRAIMLSRIRPDVGPPPTYLWVIAGVMDPETHREELRAYEEKLGTPETWPSRLDDEARLRAEATANSIVERWPEAPSGGEEIDQLPDAD